MQFLNIQYDAFNRQFSLMERELMRDPENGGTYMIAEASIEDFLPVDRSKRIDTGSLTGKRLGVA
jgi:hypothetical protein